MGFFDNIRRAFSQLDFWDKDENAHQRAQFDREAEERERRKREQQIIAQQRAQAQAQREAQARQRQADAIRQQQQAQQNPLQQTLANPLQDETGALPTKPTIKYQSLEAPQKPPMTPKQAELNLLTQRHTQEALENEKAQVPLWQRLTVDRDWDDRARNMARNRAVSEFQDRRGWGQPEPEVVAMQQKIAAEQRRMAQNSENMRQNLDKLDRGFMGLGEAASYAPITGTVMDWGLRGLEAAGNKDAGEQYKRLQLGMTSDEYNQLDDETRGKIDLLMNAGSAAGVLDFTGLGGIFKAGGKIGLRKAVQELIEQHGLKEGTKQAVKQGTKQVAKQAAPAFVAGTGLAVGAQGYLGGWDQLDPLEALKTGTMVAGTSLLDPSQGTRNIIKRSSLANIDEATNPNEVAPGVIKSPTAPQKPPQTLQQQPTPQPTPQPQPQPQPQPAPVQPPVPDVAPQPAPTVPRPGESYEIPQAPQAINPEIQKAMATAQAQADQAATAPVARADTPETAPVETQNTRASKEAPTVTAAPKSASDVVEHLEAQRQAMKDAGVDTKEVDAQIKAAKAAVKGEAPAPAKSTDPVEVNNPETLATAARESKSFLEWREGVKTNLIDSNGRMKDPVTGEEISAKQFFENARAEKSSADAKTELLTDLNKRHEAATTKQERALVSRLIRAEEQGDGSKVKAERLEKARKELSEYDAKPEATKTVPAENTTQLPTKPKNVTKQKEAGAKALDEMQAEDANLTTKPTAQQLQRGARENTTQSGKVSERWKKEQLANGANPAQLRSAIEKVEGRKVPLTPEEKAVKAQRNKLNAEARENKAKAEAEGRTKKAAPRLTKALSDQQVKSSGEKDLAGATARHNQAWVRDVKISRDTAKAIEEVNTKSDAEIVQFAEDTLTNPKNLDDPQFMFLGDAIVQRLDDMRLNKKLNYDTVDDLISKIYQRIGVRSSHAGQVNRIVRELYKRVPAQQRVTRELDKLTDHYASLKKEFKPSKKDHKELVKLTDRYDKASVNVSAAEADMELKMSDMLDDTVKKTPEMRQKLRREFYAAKAKRKAAQEEGLEASRAYAEKLESIKPPLTRKERFKSWALGAPDKAGNYLRMSMLSAPSGRLRDMFSTFANLVDQGGWRSLRTVIGATSNKLTGSNYLDSMGGVAAHKKGATGAWDKLNASWRGEQTLEEATGRPSSGDRSELSSKDTLSIFGSPQKPKYESQTRLQKTKSLAKRLITTAVQIPTDLSYGVYTTEVYARGLKAAREAGLSGDDAKLYAEMFMEHPDPKAMKESAEVWLENSGMHENFVSNTLNGVADWLDNVGSGVKKGRKTNEATASRVAKKTLARIIRTTSIPFVQYMGGATHAMLVKQNPVVNLTTAAKAAWKNDPQRAIDDLSRAGWNTAKIGTLLYVLDQGIVEMSDTDESGEHNYNGPYVVRDGRYIPASSYGIAGGSALISAHYLRKAKEDLLQGDYEGFFANSTYGPLLAGIKASGLDNALSGQTILGGLFTSVAQVQNNPNKETQDIGQTIVGGLGGDIGSQAVPAVFRDADAFLNQQEWYNPTGEAADTSGKDKFGNVNPLLKGAHQIGAGIPFVSNQLPRKSGKDAKNFVDRIWNAGTQSEQQAAAIREKEGEKQASVERVASIFKDDNLTDLLGDEARAIHDKYKGKTENISESDMKKIWTDVKDSQGKLLESGKYSSYSKVLNHEYAEMEKEGKPQNDLDKKKREITRSDIAAKHDIDPQIFRLYTGDEMAEGAGISQTELNKMMDPDEDTYDPDTAAALLAVDQLFTEGGASANDNGIDPWKRPKYKEPKNGWGGSGRGRGGAKGKGIETNFGTVGSFAKTSTSPTQKYRALTTAVPNLTQQSSKTNLKKKISVAKGVKL